jgi:hypothetical protein
MSVGVGSSIGAGLSGGVGSSMGVGSETGVGMLGSSMGVGSETGVRTLGSSSVTSKETSSAGPSTIRLAIVSQSNDAWQHNPAFVPRLPQADLIGMVRVSRHRIFQSMVANRRCCRKRKR